MNTSETNFDYIALAQIPNTVVTSQTITGLLIDFCRIGCIHLFYVN